MVGKSGEFRVGDRFFLIISYKEDDMAGAVLVFRGSVFFLVYYVVYCLEGFFGVSFCF